MSAQSGVPTMPFSLQPDHTRQRSGKSQSGYDLEISYHITPFLKTAG
jgi:hypothetical protein